MLSSLIPVLLRRRGSSAPTTLALAGAVAVSSAAALSVALWPRAALAQSMFSAADLDPLRFVLVASPVGSSGRYQLNIYEQVNTSKPCFAIGAGKPAAVNPLLATFDFTGICSRYIDANGYSVRVGPQDLAGSYRLLVRSQAGDTLLVALPTKAGVGPEMVVARAGGSTSGFHKLDFEPGWRLMRRQFRGRNLGHVYLFNDIWPGLTSSETAAPSGPATAGAAAAGAATAGAAAGAVPPASPRPLSAGGPKSAVRASSAPVVLPVPASPVKAAPLPPLPPRL